MTNLAIHKTSWLRSVIAIVAVAISLCIHWSGICSPERATSDHPIDTLIRLAEAKLDNILLQASDCFEEAIAAYKIRRNKNPPKGFDQWFELAKTSSAVIIEDFFDPIYNDLR
ncbi:hypothetical protein QWJ41_20835, partial [Nocardioides sp. SOB44]